MSPAGADGKGEWVVNGSKQFITNSGSEMTSLVTVAARTGSREDGRAEVSAIVVPADTPGFVVEPAYDKLGWHISDTHPLSFDDARVPADHLLGRAGAGIRAVPVDARRRSHRHRGPGRRVHPGVPRPVRGICGGAHHSR